MRRKFPKINLWMPRPDGTRRANKKQNYAFVLKRPREKWPTKHDVLIITLFGGTRAGKSATAGAAIADLMLSNPGLRVLIGAADRRMALRTAGKEVLMKIFSTDDGISDEYNHPIVKTAPTAYNEYTLRLHNGSSAQFVNLTEFPKLKGSGPDVIWIEEIKEIRHEAMLDEAIARLSGNKLPIRLMYITGNPDGLIGWVENRLELKKLNREDRELPIMVGNPCSCNECIICFTKKGKSFEYIDDKCPECGRTKQTKCPGKQKFIQIIQLDPTDNEAMGDGYANTMRSSMSEEKFRLLGAGEVLQTRAGNAIKAFDMVESVCDFNVPLNEAFPLIWTVDFNWRPQCSLILQDHSGLAGKAVIAQDEICLPDAHHMFLAQYFATKYAGWRAPVYLTGEPRGHNGQLGELQDSYWMDIYKYLKEKGFDVYLVAKDTQFAALKKIESINWFLKDASGNRRIMINPQCERLIMSLASVQWNKQGTNFDDRIDIEARKNTNKDVVLPVTHFPDALGYAILNLWRNEHGDYQMFWCMDSSGDGMVMQGTQVQAFTKNSEVFAASIGKDGVTKPVEKKESSTRGVLGGFMRSSGFLNLDF